MGSGPPGGMPPPPPPPPPGGPPYPLQPGYSGGPPPIWVAPDAEGATASLVLGIISVCIVPVGCCCGFAELVAVPLGIMAIIFGVRARSKITQAQGALGGSGKAMAGIITGAVSVGLAIILAGLFALLFGLSLVSPLGAIPSPTP